MEKKFTFTARRLSLTEIISPSDFHSLDNGETLSSILNTETIGQTPEDFSIDRTFWRVISIR